MTINIPFALSADLSIRYCSSEEVLWLSDALSGLRSLHRIQVTINCDDLSSGMASSILCLCVEGSSLLAGLGTNILDLHIWLRVGCFDEEEAEGAGEELGILQMSWAKIKTAQERLGSCRRVFLNEELFSSLHNPLG